MDIDVKYYCPECHKKYSEEDSRLRSELFCPICKNTLELETFSRIDSPDGAQRCDCGNDVETGTAQPPYLKPAPQLVGIRGWLILPAISMIFVPIIGAIGLFACLAQFSRVQAAGYGGVFGLEIISQLGMLVFVIYAATRFFGKKTNAPATMIAFMITGIVVSGLLLVVELGAGTEMFAVESGKALFRDVTGAAIWIPYFRVSKRVKATFTK